MWNVFLWFWKFPTIDTKEKGLLAVRSKKYFDFGKDEGSF
jgi:hypothetical protein